MALDKLVDSAQLDSDLEDVADAIRAKSGGSSLLAFPAGFISEIGNISGSGASLPDGLKDISFDISGWATGSVSQNVVTLTTASGYTSCVFPLNNPIHISSGDVIETVFTKQTGFGSASWSDSRMIAIGRVIDSNVNFGFGNTGKTLSYTATYDFDLIALYFGARLNTWNNAVLLVEFYINGVKKF